MQRVLDVQVESLDSDVVVLRVTGEVDQMTMGEFSLGLAEALAMRPRRLLVDLLTATFVSVQAYALMGRYSEFVDETALLCRNGIAARVMSVLGLRDVICSQPMNGAPIDGPWRASQWSALTASSEVLNETLPACGQSTELFVPTAEVSPS